ncbi:MAG: flagellar biosynthetic protein FliR [bacterium]|nr:flagellar biosynthetic protein FliR [bacterium]MCP5067386.1 flagellar biosynthetic protein FliR [bacterium]
MTFPLDETWTFGLVMVRFIALTVTAPFFSHSSIPMRVRVGLAMGVAMAAGARFGTAPDPVLLDAASLWGLVAREVLIGAMLGFASGLVFSGLALMGEFASIQGGLGAATVLDPTSGSSSVVLTSMIQIFGVLIFLAINGHHEVLRGLALSFSVFPVGQMTFHLEAFESVVKLGGVIFRVAVHLAAPVTAAMIISNVAVGILGRAIPQLNLMALQLPAHVATTLLILGLGAGPLTDVMARTIQNFTGEAIQAVLGVR